MDIPLQLCSNSILTSIVSCVSSSSSISPLSLRRTILAPKSCFGVSVRPPSVAAKKMHSLAVKALSPSDNPDGIDYDDAQSKSDDGDEDEDEDEDVLLPGLDLDAKLLSKLEKKLKMKVAKNVRLRRKKLVHKRRLRKKGRWPPSKTKKLSNV